MNARNSPTSASVTNASSNTAASTCWNWSKHQFLGFEGSHCIKKFFKDLGIRLSTSENIPWKNSLLLQPRRPRPRPQNLSHKNPPPTPDPSDSTPDNISQTPVFSAPNHTLRPRNPRFPTARNIGVPPLPASLPCPNPALPRSSSPPTLRAQNPQKHSHPGNPPARRLYFHFIIPLPHEDLPCLSPPKKPPSPLSTPMK